MSIPHRHLQTVLDSVGRVFSTSDVHDVVWERRLYKQADARADEVEPRIRAMTSLNRLMRLGAIVRLRRGIYRKRLGHVPEPCRMPSTGRVVYFTDEIGVGEA